MRDRYRESETDLRRACEKVLHQGRRTEAANEEEKRVRRNECIVFLGKLSVCV